MYCAVPSEELASIRPLCAQYWFHHAAWVASRLAVLAVASPPISVEAVEIALPPVHEGEATTIRYEPLLFGLKLTCTWVELTTEAVTFCPPAVIAAMVPNVWLE